MKTTTLIISAMAMALANPVIAANETWQDLREALFEDRVLTPAEKSIVIDAPYRSQEDARTRIGAHIKPPQGRYIGKVTLVLDENPMPVSAVFSFDQPVPTFQFEVTMRVNGPTPLHIVAETTDGQLYVAETFVKTSGQGACSAPPGTDEELALATLGNMAISISELDAAHTLEDQMAALSVVPDKKVDLEISHPSHSGMQMDQISLLFIPMRYIENVEIDLDGKGFVDVTGSISLSENPRLSLSVPGETNNVDVTMTDTDGTVSKASKSLAGF